MLLHRFFLKKEISTRGLSMSNIESRQSAILPARYKPFLATRFHENEQRPPFMWDLAFLLHSGSFEF